MKKNLLALLMGTMVVASLVVGCGEKAETPSENAPAQEEEQKDDADADKEDADADKEEDADVDADVEEDADVETEEDAEEDVVVVADISDSLAGTMWAMEDGTAFWFEEDGETLLGVDPEGNQAEGTYVLAAASDGEDTIVELTMTLDGEELVAYIGEITEESLVLVDEEGNVVLELIPYVFE